MPAFSNSEIGRMIADKRYTVRRGDTLSGLAGRFKGAFPALRRFSGLEVEGMIFSGNKHAFVRDNKNVLLSDQYLKLDFILEARRGEFKFDCGAGAYVFTDEDRLAFALDERDFWDCFCRCDRDCGEFLRESFEEQGLSSLPQSMSLNHRVNGSCCHKDLVESVRRGVGAFKKAVKLDMIAENILKNIGFASPSNSQIEACCKKLSEENHLNTCNHEKCICIPTDQIENLSTMCVEEFYKKASLNSEDERNLEQGFYVLTQIDIDLAKNNRNLFWEKLLPDSSERNNTLQARSKAGYTNDISTLRAGKKILIAAKNAVQKIENRHGDSLKKLEELAKICDISLPCDFTQKVSSTILKETHNNSNTVKFLENIEWREINTLHMLPKSLLEDIKAIVIKSVESLSFLTEILQLERLLKGGGMNVVTKKYMLNKINDSKFSDGYYRITDDDLRIMDFLEDKTRKIILDKIYASIGSSNTNTTKEARNACGYPVGTLHTDELSKGRVFVVTDKSMSSVSVQIGSDVSKTVPADYISYLQMIGLFANFINGSQEIRKICITSYWRTPEEQRDIVYRNVEKYYKEEEQYAMYKGFTGQTARKMIAERKSEEEIKAFIMSRIPNNPGFKHVNNTNTLDIGANSNLDPEKECFIKSLEHFKSKAVIIENVLFKDGPEGEKNCHHIVFKS